MLNNKEETKLLSDDEFERIGRRKKTIVSIMKSLKTLWLKGKLRTSRLFPIKNLQRI